MEKAVLHTYQEVFSWKTGQELGSSLAMAGKEAEGATSREAGVWGASRRFFRAHPSHESRGSPRRVERSDLQRSGGGLCGLASLFTLWLCCCRSARFVLSLSPPLPPLFYLLSVSLILSLLPLSSLSLTPRILFPAFACLSLPLRVLLLLPVLHPLVSQLTNCFAAG